MAKFRIDIDNKKISRKINRKIEDGIEDAADEINDKMRQAAKGKIRDKKAVWRKELLHGFTDSKIEISGRTIA
jgi:cell division protein ZapA (FtsZ GTPase activity inhibitor)